MRADRLISILLRLQAHNGITARTLAQELEVSSRTIYRDIEALSMAGIPVYAQRGENGGLFLDEQYKVSLTNLLLPEIQALFVMGGAAPLEALNMEQAVENSLLKLLATLPSHYQMEAQALQQRLFIDTERWNQAHETLEWLDVLQSAVWQDRVINAIYQSHNEQAKVREIQAYGLVVKAHIWYLIGIEGDETDSRVYRVSRFQDVSISEKIFERDEAFDLKQVWYQKSQYFEQLIAADYEVRLQLPESLLRALTYFIPNRYQIVDTQDALLTVTAQFYNVNEARTILLGFGNQVDVIEPQSLADSILDYAQSIVEKMQD